MTADTRISQYVQGRQAFAILTGEIDKDAQKAALVDGYKALHSLRADNVSIRQVQDMTGLSKGKVERDCRAAELIVLFPKVDPVTVVKACNIATAAQLRKATEDAKTAGKGLATIVSDYNKKRREEDAAKRSARPNDGTTEAPEVPEVPEVPEGPKAPAKTATAADLVAFIMAAPFSAAEFAKIENAARLMKQNKEKAEAAVETA
jgi:hypothetical protein